MRGIPERCLAEVCPTRGSIAAPRPTRAANHLPRPLAIAPSSARAGALEPLPTLSRGMTVRRRSAPGSPTCFIIDVFSRMIVGWRVASHMRTEMLCDALEMARRSRRATAITRPNTSAAPPGLADGAPSRTSNWPPWAGSTGTPAGCTATSATYRRPRSKGGPTLPSRPPLPGRNQIARASTRPSPVQGLFVVGRGRVVTQGGSWPC
jgi:hypothetical protein